MKLFKKKKSQFYWYDFTVRGKRLRGSTEETNAARAARLLASNSQRLWKAAIRWTGKLRPCGSSPGSFLEWVDGARLEAKTKALLPRWLASLGRNRNSGDAIGSITNDAVETLSFLARVQHQLRASNLAPDASQSRRMETDSTRSQTEAGEGIRTLAKA